MTEDCCPFSLGDRHLGSGRQATPWEPRSAPAPCSPWASSLCPWGPEAWAPSAHNPRCWTVATIAHPSPPRLCPHTLSQMAHSRRITAKWLTTSDDGWQKQGRSPDRPSGRCSRAAGPGLGHLPTVGSEGLAWFVLLVLASHLSSPVCHSLWTLGPISGFGSPSLSSQPPKHVWVW